jgi:hypothetical protein
VFNLNYDECLEAAGIDYYDGFADDGSFDVMGFLDRWPQTNVHCHLHGSVLFGFEGYAAIESANKYSSASDAAARTLWFSTTTDSGERIFHGAIISGLPKAEKILFKPYSKYHHAFVESIMSSPRVLVIGYGGHDTYLNHWILTAWRLHGDQLRVAFLTRKAPLSEIAQERAGQFVSLFAGRENAEMYLREIVEVDEVTFRDQRSLPIADSKPFGAAEKVCAFLEA